MGNHTSSQGGISQRAQDSSKNDHHVKTTQQPQKPLRRSVSEQKNAEFFYNSCPLMMDSHSPLRKRIKLMDHSYLSLPNNFPLGAAANQLINNNNSYNRLAPITEYCGDQAYCRNTYGLPVNRHDLYSNRNSTYSTPPGLMNQWTDTDDGSYTVNDTNSVTSPHSPAPSKSVTFDEKSVKIQQRKRRRKSRLFSDFVDIFSTSTKSEESSPKKMRKSDQESSTFETNTLNRQPATSCGPVNENVHNNEKSATLSPKNKICKPTAPSLSAWLLNDHYRYNAKTTSVDRGNKGISALRKSASSSLDTPGKLAPGKNTWSWRTSPLRKRDRSVASSSDDDSLWTESLNSLTDGRTSWPTPKLEAIFLPEFPHRGLINEDSFLTLGTIAKGTFGKVYRVGLSTKPDSIFAMKVQKKSTIIAKDAVQQVKAEISIHQALGNSNFVAQIYCTWQNRTNLYMVLQYVPSYGDMHQLWKDELPFNEKVIKIWIAELATALDFIHGSGIIYRDIKMENILLDDNGHIQLIDFGLAKWLNYGERTNTICGTLQYMAPEVLNGDYYNHGADWWSLGVLTHALLTGAYPFGVSDSHTTMCITDYEPDQALSQPAKSLLSKLLRKDPKWRLRSFTLLKCEKFFSDTPLDGVQNKKVHPFDFIPRMKRCFSCNIDDDDMQNLEDCASVMFGEDYDAFQEFDYFSDDM